MDVMVERGCGLDVHQATGVACLLTGPPGTRPHKQVRTFRTGTAALRERRELPRYRRKLVETCAAERNRLLELPETANINPGLDPGVASDVFGASGMAMLEALIAGTATPAERAALARGRLRQKRADLELALEGCVEEHPRCLLGGHLRRLQTAEHDIGELDARITLKLEPSREPHRRLMQIRGLDGFIAAVILAELGIDMTVFPSAAHAAAWAGMCPGNCESAGKRHGGRLRKGNQHLKTALVTAAAAASHKSGGSLKDKDFRRRARRGPLRAAVAIGRKILIAACHRLATGADFKDLGADHLDTTHKQRTIRTLLRRLNRLGYKVALMPLQAGT